MLARRRAARSPRTSAATVDAAPARPGARLVPEPRPRRDLRGARARATSATSASTCSPHVPSDPSAPIKQVAAGRADLAISYEPEVLLAREQGLPVVAVAALVQRPLTSLMATEQVRRALGARPARQARRHRRDPVPVGLPEDDPRARERARVLGEGDERRREPAARDALRARSTRRWAAFWNVEGVELRQRRQRPWIAPVDRLGVPDYDELVLVANEDDVDDKRDDLRLFISARRAGRARGARGPGRRGPGAARREPRPEARARPARACALTIPALFPEKRDQPWGYLDPVQWRNYGGWMVDNGLLEGAARRRTRRSRTSCCRAKGSRLGSRSAAARDAQPARAGARRPGTSACPRRVRRSSRLRRRADPRRVGAAGARARARPARRPGRDPARGHGDRAARAAAARAAACGAARARVTGRATGTGRASARRWDWRRTSRAQSRGSPGSWQRRSLRQALDRLPGLRLVGAAPLAAPSRRSGSACTILPPIPSIARFMASLVSRIQPISPHQIFFARDRACSRCSM